MVQDKKRRQQRVNQDKCSSHYMTKHSHVGLPTSDLWLLRDYRDTHLHYHSTQKYLLHTKEVTHKQQQLPSTATTVSLVQEGDG